MTEITLRPYQQKALEAVKAAFKGQDHPSVVYRKGHQGPCQNVVLVMPCRSGKTYTFSAIAKGAGEKGNNVNIMAHRKELIFQASKSLASLGVFHRLVAPNNKKSALIRVHVDLFSRPYINRSANVAMSSIQTLTRRMGFLEDFRPALHIVDECHRSLSVSYVRVFEHSPYARILGVTATPCRGDGKPLGDIYQAMVIGPSHAELQALGNLLPAKVFAPPVRADFAGVGRKNGDLDADQQAEKMDRPEVTDDAVTRYMKNCPHRPGIVYCCNRKHAAHVAKQFQQAGVKAFVIDGTMEDRDRDRLINGQADGSVELLVSVDLISEGTDLVCAEVAILLRKTDSLALYIQQTNRVLTPGEGKEYGLIHDHVGNVHEHGMPDEFREWSLDGEMKPRSKSETQEKAPKIIQCVECYHVHPPAPECPQCGYKYEARQWKMPKQSDEELKELDAAHVEAERINARRAQGQARDLQALKAQGMSTGRAQHILAARAEKERLQGELSKMMRAVVDAKGAQAPGAIGYKPHEIKTMKPKQLREEIDRLGGMLFGFTNNEDETDEREHALEDSAARRA